MDLLSWFLTIGIWLGVFYIGGVKAAAAPGEHFAILIVSANAYGLTTATLALVKGHLFPDSKDRRFSGSIFHDFLAGVELNPRLGRHWDLKMFHIGRLGMNSWVILYLSTIDITHDHFGFYLGWGSAVWLPFVYTMQTQYLASHCVQLSPKALYTILATGISGYYLFRLANHQKYSLRQKGEECRIWGDLPRIIKAEFTTADGERHNTSLLFSGKP
ncbi:hypothetical protein HIM_12374 [Hirsutella minnesotensis 3608]|uniref:7-dehydrocholesterol reductase n=1 Tax=Hirsutella minnesotensis 3608 TaxID=1043627 RepID=A0A0F7ZEZ1_9HYPO|nr:hypothetical protein HIM_12374 [Hirsutella minnesotensis 3608]